MSYVIPDVLTIGRVGIDIYPLQIGLPLEHVTSFGKYLGGSPTNQAVAAARLGSSSAIVTAVGDDPFGRFARDEMVRLGVHDDYVHINCRRRTPVTFCEIFPPDDFPLYFYRDSTSPDFELASDDIPVEAVRNAKVMMVTASGLAVEPSRSAHKFALTIRPRHLWTILDLDYRPDFWQARHEAAFQVNSVISMANVVVGNNREAEIATGESDPHRAAEVLVERGAELAIVKCGADGSVAKTREKTFVVPGIPITTLNGLGSGDAFGGALAHGLAQHWEIPEILRFASASGAIVASRLECSEAMPTANDVTDLLAAFPTAVPDISDR